MKNTKYLPYIIALAMLAVVPITASALNYINPYQISASGSSNNQVLTNVNGTTSWANAGAGSFTTTTINGLSSTAYTFATSGPVLSISGSGSTLTWALPTSTASQTGVLTGTDWTTFNGKQNNIAWPIPVASTSLTAGTNITIVGNTINSTGGGGTLSGFGTSTQVAYYNTSSTLTSSANLTFDGTNLTNTGTTTAGTFKLSGLSSNVQIYANADNNTGILFPGPDIFQINSAGKGTIFIDATQDTNIGTSTSQNNTLAVVSNSGNPIFKVYTSSTPPTAALTITNAGNVGIGTTTPATTLHVVGNTTLGTLTGLLKGTSGLVGTASAGVDYQTPASSTINTLIGPWTLVAGTNITLSSTTNPSAITINSTASGGGLSTTTPFSAGYIPQATSSSAVTNSNIFQSGSNVGIGTTTPAQLLEVNGQMQVDATSTMQGNVVINTGSSATSTASIGQVGNAGCIETRDSGNGAWSNITTIAGFLYISTGQCN